MAISSFSSFSVLPPPPPPPPPEAKAVVPPQPEPQPEPPKPNPKATAVVEKPQSAPAEMQGTIRALSSTAPRPAPAVAPDPTDWKQTHTRRKRRRWPAVLLATTLGVGGGYYYHTQQPAVYHSTAELRTARSGAAEEVKSAKVLQRAAALLNPAEFQDAPPASLDERTAYLQQHFTASRKPSANVVSLTFDGANPDDAPKYLAAIVAAYRDEFSPAPAAVVPAVPTANAAIEQLERDREEAAAVLRDAKPVDADALRALRDRIALQGATRDELVKAQQDIDKQIAQIDAMKGKPRRDREVVRIALNIPASPGSDLDERRASLVKERDVLRDTRGLGPDHPEMREIAARIEKVETEMMGSTRLDALDAYRDELAQRRTATQTVLDKLVPAHAEAQQQADALTAQQEKHDAAQSALDKLDEQLAKATAEPTPGEVPAPAAAATLEVTSPPGPAVQVSPDLKRSLAVGGGLGLAGGCLLALGAGLFSGSGGTPSVRGRRLGSALLGRLPKIKTDAAAERPTNAGLDRLLATFYRPSSSDAEAFRQVRSRIYSAIEGKLNRVIQVTSATTGDGKSVLAANLAITIAQTGRRVLLIDGNLRTPRAQQLLNRRSIQVGLCSVLNGESRLESAIVATDVPNLALLPCGPIPNDPAELLGSAKFAELIAEVRPAYDYVVVDSPAVLNGPDAGIVAQRADGVVMVVRAAKEAESDAERANAQLAAARVLGAVENTCPGRTVLFAAERPELLPMAEEEAPLPKKG